MHIFDKNYESYLFPDSPLPALIASNLVAHRTWCTGFQDLIRDAGFLEHMRCSQPLLEKLAALIENADDLFIIQQFHAAWSAEVENKTAAFDRIRKSILPGTRWMRYDVDDKPRNVDDGPNADWPYTTISHE